MAVSQAFLDMIHDMLAPLGALSVRRMFGLASLYCDGILFALIDDDVLYLKADAATKARYESEGLGPLTYEGQTGPVAMPYWRTPDRLYDEPEEFIEFAREAISVAITSKSGKVPSRSRKPKASPKSRPGNVQSRVR